MSGSGRMQRMGRGRGAFPKGPHLRPSAHSPVHVSNGTATQCGKARLTKKKVELYK